MRADLGHSNADTASTALLYPTTICLKSHVRGHLSHRFIKLCCYDGFYVILVIYGDGKKILMT